MSESVVLGWVAKVALSKAADAGLKLFAKDDVFQRLSKDLDKAVGQWAERLPDQFRSLEPRALFASDVRRSTDGPNRPRMQILWKTIENGEIPREVIWLDALMDQWETVRQNLGDGAELFFRIPPGEAKPLLEGLAKQLELVGTKDSKLFQSALHGFSKWAEDNITEVLGLVRSIDNKLDVSGEKTTVAAPAIDFRPFNRMGNNKVVRSDIQASGKFTMYLVFYLRRINTDHLQRIMARYHIGNTDFYHPLDSNAISIDKGPWQELNLDGDLIPLCQLEGGHLYTVVYRARLRGVQSASLLQPPKKIVLPDKPEDAEGTDYGKGSLTIKFMDAELVVPFFLNPGGEMLLTEDGWYRPCSL